MSPPNFANQFGDTTYTKVFVGGLAWETQKETMRKYFEQFGEILEAVVITDKNTGRSKGYGFVTFSEPEAAMRACVDPAPVIDGRRANCNLASFGVQRSTPTTPQGSNRSIRVMKSFPSGAIGFQGTAFQAPPAVAAGAAGAVAGLHHTTIQQGIPYNLYGYPQYSAEYNYPTSYYNVYGQYPMYGGAASFYPYYQFGQGASYGHAAQGYNMQYPQMFQYSALASSTAVTGFNQHYGGPMSITPNPTAQAGMTMALSAPTLPSTPASHHYRLLPAYFTPTIASEQPLT